MKAKIVSLACFMLLISCNSSSVYSKFDSNFQNNRWQKTDVKQYNFTIENDAQLYNLVFKFSHIYNYNFSLIPVAVNIKNPSGEIETFSTDVVIKDKSGKELGDCAGDICDLTQSIKNNIKLKKGAYTITIANAYEGNYLPNVLGIGLEVEIAK